MFQDPISSLNPRRRVGDIVGAPLKIWKIGTEAERRAKVDAALETVGLDPEVARDKRPHEFSGGQCQRICIARALVLEPKVLICDEPVSALDVSVQAQILNLLEDLKARYGLTLVFITHDLAVVKNVSDRVAVMYLGKLCELAPPERLYAAPAHPYTRRAAVGHPGARSRRAGRGRRAGPRRAALAGGARRAAAASAPAAPAPRSGAPRRSPRSARSRTGSSSPATSRWWARRPRSATEVRVEASAS